MFCIPHEEHFYRSIAGYRPLARAMKGRMNRCLLISGLVRQTYGPP